MVTIIKRNQKLLGVLLAVTAALLCLFALPQTAEAIPAFEEAIIIADEVNMRLRPTVDSPFVLKLTNGTRVGVFCEEVDGWYRIIYGNYRGYVSKDYVFLPSTDIFVGNILDDATPVLQSPLGGAQELATLDAGVGVTIKSIQGDFYCVEYGNTSAEESLPQPSEEATDEITTEDAPIEITTSTSPVPDSSASPAPESSETPVEELANTATPTGAHVGYVKKAEVKPSKSKNPATMLKEGMKGAEIVKMQRELKSRGFLDSSATGEFGSKTKAAIMLFQDKAGLSSDGIAGAQTLEMLYGDNDIKVTYAERIGLSGGVGLTPWTKMDDIFYKGCVATVTDVKTGISWQEKRFGGWFHADCEPLTKQDSANMKKAYGGSWSWDRRAVWVTIDGVSYAASINGMPHLGYTIKDNNFPGHHCIHFYKSKVHETSRECPRHQAAVQYAYKSGN